MLSTILTVIFWLAVAYVAVQLVILLACVLAMLFMNKHL